MVLKAVARRLPLQHGGQVSVKAHKAHIAYMPIYMLQYPWG
jgi:hypothetical protein